MEAVLVSNGPGELYSWAQPVLRTLRELHPELRICISLVPDQFTSGQEAEVAQSFGADLVTSRKDFLTLLATGRPPAGLGGGGFVLSLGGNARMALRLAASLGYPTYRYSFVPYWNRDLRKLFVHNAAAERKARLLGAPRDKLLNVGNLVADAVGQASPAAAVGSPHILLMAGTRDAFSVLLIPFIIAVADYLGREFPAARFVWPVSRLLKQETITAGIAGREKASLGGMAGQLEGSSLITPSGVPIEMVPDTSRHAHMRAASLAVTIPGTNTLELGIAGVPSIVVLPMNKPEVIPLEGVGHWLGLLPFVGTALKRQAVKVFVEGLDVPVSLPNRFSGEDLMLELKGTIRAEEVARQAAALLKDTSDLKRRRERLLETMPKPGAAERLVSAILEDFA